MGSGSTMAGSRMGCDSQWLHLWAGCQLAPESPPLYSSKPSMTGRTDYPKFWKYDNLLSVSITAEHTSDGNCQQATLHKSKWKKEQNLSLFWLYNIPCLCCALVHAAPKTKISHWALNCVLWGEWTSTILVWLCQNSPYLLEIHAMTSWIKCCDVGDLLQNTLGVNWKVSPGGNGESWVLSTSGVGCVHYATLFLYLFEIFCKEKKG